MHNQSAFLTLRQHLEKTIVGQHKLLDRLMISLLTGGHILLEGPPGLAKTTAVNTLADGVHASFQRMQFTPDLMPGDLTGTDIYDPETRQFNFLEGPIFHDIILADEINRAPPKVQSALLEAMAERQVTVGGVTRELSALFVVMATQNPIEQSGTYPLPEAQLDRFLLHVVLDYPTPDEELQILQRDRLKSTNNPRGTQNDNFKNDSGPDSILTPDLVLSARSEVREIHVDEMLERYIVALVTATRQLGALEPKWESYLLVGASPRASIALLKASSALAYLQGRDYVIPEDIHNIVFDVFRHRMVLAYAGRAADICTDDITCYLLEKIPVP